MSNTLRITGMEPRNFDVTKPDKVASSTKISGQPYTKTSQNPGHSNSVTTDLDNKDMVTKFCSKEEKYYISLSKVETVMQKLDSQQNWIAGQLGGNI